MLKSLFKTTLNRVFQGDSWKTKAEALSVQIKGAEEARDWPITIGLLKEFLELDPKNVSALVKLGIILNEVGEIQEANEKFELAHRLDDSNMEVVVNYARCMMDAGQEDQALHSLIRAQTVIPDYSYINTIYASLQLRFGNMDAARKFALRAWLANYDNNRAPNGFLWHSAYFDQSEDVLAAEHHFWAQTMLPVAKKVASQFPVLKSRDPSRKMRIGYWSPDFRDHSVRYFFRPLLEGHDKNRVELFLYHDSSSSDIQTEEIKAKADHFHAVYNNSDENLVKLIASHDLDILVELAGHTSHNRLWLLQGRLARVQVTGLGYPPTTGLETVDVKLLDPHLRTPGDERFYSEAPLELPQSFWCFDPRGNLDEPGEPPVLKAGHITFGCYGNIGKVNPKIIAMWEQILRRVPRSQLLIRSVNFQSEGAIKFFIAQMIAGGIKRERFTLAMPVTGAEFFRAYDQLDIVLDTHPFNGGTTTCFAAYMGVPVVTLKGDSLISRMGASVVANAGAPQLAVSTPQEYVSKAINLSQDIDFLKRFRKEARVRMKETSLGDGQKFAHDIENAFETLLANAVFPVPPRPLKIIPLPPQELIRRAAAVLGYGRWDASERIVHYCLEHYPDFAGAHIMLTENLTKDGKFEEAAQYLSERLDRFDEVDRAASLVNIIRFWIFAGQWDEVAKAVQQLEAAAFRTEEEKSQTRLFQALLDARGKQGPDYSPLRVGSRNIKCVVPCDDSSLYKKIATRLEIHAKAVSAQVTVEQCSEGLKITAYEAALQTHDADIVIFIQKNIDVLAEDFFALIVEALKSADVVGFSGAKRWSRLDWRLDDFIQRAGAFTLPSAEKEGYSEIRIAGPGTAECVKGMAVLEGGLLAVNARKVSKIAFDEEWMDADALVEERWSYDAGKAGARLSVHRGLGVYIDSTIPLSTRYMVVARTLLVEKMKFDLFSTERNDGAFLVSPCANADEGFKATRLYLQKAPG